MSFIGTRLEGRNVGHFIFDLWFYIDDGNAPQALEFDVNRAFGGTRWTWGSECDFNKTGRWNLWDHLHGEWIPTWVDCHHFHRNVGPPGVHTRARRQPSALHQPKRGRP